MNQSIPTVGYYYKDPEDDMVYRVISPSDGYDCKCMVVALGDYKGHVFKVGDRMLIDIDRLRTLAVDYMYNLNIERVLE